jgi:hypothetical protein
LDVTDQEETPKNVTTLLHNISKILIITTPIHNTKTIEDRLDNLSQKIEMLTKNISHLPLTHKTYNPQTLKTQQTTIVTGKKHQPSTQNPLA